jgi:excisionase family DNA binding protein
MRAVDEGNTNEIEWLSTKEAAAFLGVQVAVVLKVINAGSLRAYRPGLRNIRIRRSDLEAYLETRIIEPGSLVSEDDEDQDTDDE